LGTNPSAPYGTDIISRHSYGLAAIADSAPLDSEVPTCSDWTLAALVWHLTKVQRFWTHILSHRPAGPEDYQAPSPPDDENSLADGLRNSCDGLVEVLNGADPSDPAWSWAAEQTVGFSIRRQSHEALIHHCDGLISAGLATPEASPALGADGVDEVVSVMLCEVPQWARFDPTSGVIQLAATDVDQSWTLAFGRVTGVAPDTGQAFDLDGFALSDAAGSENPESADAVVSADAFQLDLWLWGRPATGIMTKGDTELVHRFRSILNEVTSG